MFAGKRKPWRGILLFGVSIHTFKNLKNIIVDTGLENTLIVSVWS